MGTQTHRHTDTDTDTWEHTHINNIWATALVHQSTTTTTTTPTTLTLNTTRVLRSTTPPPGSKANGPPPRTAVASGTKGCGKSAWITMRSSWRSSTRHAASACQTLAASGDA